MRIPSFISDNNKNRQLTNLMLNCRTAVDFRAWLESLAMDISTEVNGFIKIDHDEIDACAAEFTKTQDYTVLSPYYFVQSKNDPENELKILLTKYIP